MDFFNHKISTKDELQLYVDSDNEHDTNFGGLSNFGYQQAQRQMGGSLSPKHNPSQQEKSFVQTTDRHAMRMQEGQLANKSQTASQTDLRSDNRSRSNTKKVSDLKLQDLRKYDPHTRGSNTSKTRGQSEQISPRYQAGKSPVQFKHQKADHISQQNKSRSNSKNSKGNSSLMKNPVNQSGGNNTGLLNPTTEEQNVVSATPNWGKARSNPVGQMNVPQAHIRDPYAQKQGGPQPDLNQLKRMASNQNDPRQNCISNISVLRGYQESDESLAQHMIDLVENLVEQSPSANLTPSPAQTAPTVQPQPPMVSTFGKLKYKNGNVYEGQLLNGKRSGNGTMTFSNGDVYVGMWKNDQMNDFEGLYTFSNGNEYKGSFRHSASSKFGVFHGSGTLKVKDLGVLTGSFEENLVHGPGRFEFSENETEFESKWDHLAIDGFIAQMKQLMSE